MEKGKKVFIPIVTAVFLILVLAIFMIYYFINREHEKDIVEYLKDLKSYSCSINIEVKNGKQHIEYNGKQMYRLGSGYRLELNDKKRVMIYKENKVYVQDVENNKSYTLPLKVDDVYNMTFIGKYIGMLYTAENIKYSIKSIEGIQYALIKITIPCQNKNMSYGVLYVDLKDKCPTELKIYDVKNEERLRVQYKEFQPDPSLEDNLFEPVNM
ncbi:outer membrane lipoprotein-sorting protein [Clostridium acetobutylicum]|uniref:Uncharacterized probably secreted protein, homolog of YDCC B.subtilis n=1 Tax=Clostridium acetobutylicum (strain ATCC 824 / DSM 792 / JCM 1419 / IAM 19013 / LMG 5710 / NBRC 13948 / NRRL B-527 / VKM B-1787 / 2291 / W) TaxID=272562 RepID=Q97LR3_CLOAB|nr:MULTISPECIES: germination lipoprotein GerS-related protein [Clostridium]AAK78471.1 Uncharacterized probably secreted protein, homolog of YDCC B.subtilis [Clostridium acetobutylicum ATCC 824]ADZ19541.1 Conserved hypothetical protein [Clostridium acetobutylicum EA 2018]AEI31273.1 hypothetical protein SMB_G0501 [Clostridium acetobutylicum DSM 1731]AWV80193.1 outer membrane lipoprotein carrier protein LolA [Clostridium acetobutylicum]MBC2392374.1 outer membrane lipoprotein carrier protein LolA 